MRDMTPEMQAGLESPVIRPVVIAHLDILGDPISMWTGAGNFAPTGSPDEILNGKVYVPDRSFVDMSTVSEDDGIGGPLTIVLKGNDLNQDVLRQVVRDRRRWRGRDAYVWLGLLNEELNAVYEYPVRIKTGLMTRAVVSRSASDTSVEFVIDVDLQNAQSAPFRIVDHMNVHPGDTFASFVTELSNRPEGLDRSRAQAGPRPGQRPPDRPWEDL